MSVRRDNTFLAVKTFISLLGVKVTASSLEAVLCSNPSYPGIDSITHVLNEFNIPHRLIRVAENQVEKIPLPAIVHTLQNDGHFVVLTEINGTSVKYIDPGVGPVFTTLDRLLVDWTGIVLVAEILGISGEHNYRFKAFQQVVEYVIKKVSLVLAILLGLVPLSFLQADLKILYLLTSVGSIVSIVMILKESGQNSYMSRLFCSPDSDSCMTVLNSRFSKVAGVRISELCFLYFASSALNIALVPIVGKESLLIYKALSIVALLMTLISLYIQLFKLKKFCGLCIAIICIVWAQLLIQKADLKNIDGFELLPGAIVFCSVFVIWVAMRGFFWQATVGRNLKQELLLLKQKKEVIEAFIVPTSKKFPQIATPLMKYKEGEIKKKIILVVSPFCLQCHSAIWQARTIVETFDDINVEFIISASVDQNSESFQMGQHIMAIQIQMGTDFALQALFDWSGRAEYDLEKWKRDYSIKSGCHESLTWLQAHSEWCKEMGILKSPTVFFQEMELKPPISIEDLKSYLHSIN